MAPVALDCLSPGSRRAPIRIRNRTPAMVTGRPTQNGPKRVRGSIPCSWPEAMAFEVRPAMMRFTKVPIRVMVPPRIEAKLAPIRSFDGEIPVLRATSRMTGIIMATIGVLLRNELAIAMGGKILICAAPWVLGCPIRCCDKSVMAPVEYIPAATGKSAATVMTPTLPNPLSRASGGARCNVLQAVNVPINTSQFRNLPHTSRANIPARIATMIHA
jgi:hypothetical protein